MLVLNYKNVSHLREIYMHNIPASCKQWKTSLIHVKGYGLVGSFVFAGIRYSRVFVWLLFIRNYPLRFVGALISHFNLSSELISVGFEFISDLRIFM